MNLIEKAVLKLAWKRAEGKMQFLKRWAPIVGVITLVGSVALRTAGLDEAATIVEGAGNVTGVNQQSPVSGAEIAAAVAAGAGVVMKVWAMVQKIKAGK